MYKILIVEDEVISANYLKLVLSKQGWEVVDIVDNAVDTIKSVKKYDPHLILMDIMINGPTSGCDTALEVRAISNCSIIFLTAFADEEMISYAMNVNANGYLMKPYKEQEIIANISLLASKKYPTKNSITQKPTIFTYKNGLLYKNDEIIKLSPKLLQIIKVLYKNQNQFTSYEDLYKNIWDDELNLKKLQMAICRIREIVGKDLIDNIKELGYKIKQ